MKDSAVVYRNFMQAVKKLPVEKQGEAYEAYMLYAMDGQEYTGDDYAIAALIESFRSQLEDDRNKYTAKCERTKKINSERTRNDVDTKSSRNRTDIVSDNDIDIDSKETTPKGVAKKERFVPPTVEDVRAYCRERKNSIDPNHFIDYYMSKGWKVGKDSPMKDWKACIRTWEQHEEKPEEKPPDKQGITRSGDLDAIMMNQIRSRRYG